MKLTFREAEPADVPALLAIENESFASPNWTDEDFLKYDCCIAEINRKIAGFLVSRELYAGDSRNAAQREILNLAVAPPFRRRGVATALILREVQRSAQLFLEVRESNIAAQELYRKLGFVEISRRQEYYQSPLETAIVMNMK